MYWKEIRKKQAGLISLLAVKHLARVVRPNQPRQNVKTQVGKSIFAFSNLLHKPKVQTPLKSDSGERQSLLAQFLSTFGTRIEGFYDNPYTVRGMFRFLTPLAKDYVFRLFFATSPCPLESLKQWSLPDPLSIRMHAEAIKRLDSFRIFQVLGPKGSKMVALSQYFRQHLVFALYNSDANLPVQHAPHHVPTLDQLQQYAQFRAAAPGPLHYRPCCLEAAAGKKQRALSLEDAPGATDQVELLVRLGLMRPVGAVAPSTSTATTPGPSPAPFSKRPAPSPSPPPPTPASGRYETTGEGYQFLLKRASTQLWTFMISYLKGFRVRPCLLLPGVVVAVWGRKVVCAPEDRTLVEALGFLFRLTMMTVGRPQEAAALTPTQMQVMRDLRAFGLIYQRKDGAAHFIPTPLVSVLALEGAAAPARPSSRPARRRCPGAARGGPTDLEQGWIVVESTTCPVPRAPCPVPRAPCPVPRAPCPVPRAPCPVPRVRLHGQRPARGHAWLFVQLQYRLPNLVVGSVTLESVRRALMFGITADQITSFLYQHAHPQQRLRRPVIPEAVRDQIFLWEAERNRLLFQRAAVFEGLPPPVHQAAVAFAREQGVLLCEVAAKGLLVVPEAEKGPVHAHIVDLMTRAAALPPQG
ncbi:putative general transcription factor IIH [Paratrimastix pyriformis]|uniref:General transcription factor IIH subunit 4 n=1 Tax=Paratrimastix pyriformis TaxID=342808 RepID=A0ABQ8UTI2_9EUKA|nr:putative general transcription factor IIH [Paratrimastix pyriformis]